MMQFSPFPPLPAPPTPDSSIELPRWVALRLLVFLVESFDLIFEPLREIDDPPFLGTRFELALSTVGLLVDFVVGLTSCC